MGRGLALVLMAGCSVTPTSPQAGSMFAATPGPRVIAHRGGSLEAPENTVAAARHGATAGADWVEIDVTLSADEELVVIHDDTVDRTTGAQGVVRNMPLHALRALDAGRGGWTTQQREQLALFNVTPPDFGERFKGERIPTLREVLAVDIRLMIEMKEIEHRMVERFARTLVETIAEEQAWERVVIGSFETDLLWAVHDLEPSLPLIGIAETSEGIEEMLALPVAALAVRLDHVKEAVEKAAGRAFVWGWTAYNVEMAKAAIEQGASGVITDVPALLVQDLRAVPDLYIRAGEEP